MLFLERVSDWQQRIEIFLLGIATKEHAKRMDGYSDGK
jgi:hypothetical protein